MKNLSRAIRVQTPARAVSVLALACACMCAATAQAQTTLPETVVSASRTEQRPRDTLPATTVITREDIERSQAADLPTLLQRVTGIQITQSGGPGTVSSAFTRGAESRHTLVLVDGVAVNNLNFSLAAIEHLSLANVDRIEVVRGNVSALYGSAALGGVVQIFTRAASTTPQASFTAQAGSRGTRQLSASGGVRTAGGTSFSVGVDDYRTDGFNSINQAERPFTNPDRDGYDRRSVSAGVSQEFGAGHSVGVRVRESRGTVNYDSQFGPATQADVSGYAERGASVDGRFKLGADVVLTAQLNSASDHLNGSVTAFPYYVNSDSRGAQLGLEWQIVPGQRITAGYERTRQRVDSDTAYTKEDRDLNSLRLGWQGDMGPHQLQLNVRKDRYSDYGSANTYYAGYGYKITDAWRISASRSTGFMVPTFNDLFQPFGGNPNLRPEELKSTELALQYAAGAHEVRATLFDNRYVDLIGNDAFFNRANIAKAENRGLELAYTGRLGHTTLRAGITGQDPVDSTTGARLARRAATLANLGVSHDFGPWNVGGDLRYTGTRPDGIRTLESYAVVDLTAAYSVNRNVKVFGRLENLLDKRYETVYGYNQARRGVFVGLTWTPTL